MRNTKSGMRWILTEPLACSAMSWIASAYPSSPGGRPRSGSPRLRDALEPTLEGPAEYHYGYLLVVVRKRRR
jgi:hypothetical protein